MSTLLRDLLGCKQQLTWGGCRQLLHPGCQVVAQCLRESCGLGQRGLQAGGHRCVCACGGLQVLSQAHGEGALHLPPRTKLVSQVRQTALWALLTGLLSAAVKPASRAGTGGGAPP